MKTFLLAFSFWIEFNIKLNGTPKPNSILLSSSVYLPLCRAINFKLLINMIGEPDDPPFVPNE